MNLPKAESFNTMWTWFSVMLRNRSAHARVWLATEFKEARFHYVRFQAEKGEPSAEYKMGLIYETGEHGVRSEYEAHRWFLRAAFHGVAAAQSKVSNCSTRGDPARASTVMRVEPWRTATHDVEFDIHAPGAANVRAGGDHVSARNVGGVRRLGARRIEDHSNPRALRTGARTAACRRGAARWRTTRTAARGRGWR